jgi:lipid-A-disaccharide synthase
LKYFVIAGEASGDLHGANLIKSLKKEDPDAEFLAWGGDLMEAAGAKVLKHFKELAFMGFLVVIQNIRTILGNEKLCKSQIAAFKPDAIIFIDYPGFNLRIAKWAKKNHFKTLYYISPKVWAWKQSRAWAIKKNIDKLYVIFPFEVPFYKEYDYDVEFVGHPLMDAIAQFQNHSQTFESFTTENNISNKPIIAVLPGSRNDEIRHMLPTMLETAKSFPEYQFVIAGAPSQDVEFYYQIAKTRNLKIVFGKTYDLLNHSTAGLITSGTATLETALFNVPQIVCYAGNRISYEVASRLIKVKYISLVNLVLDAEVVKEFIQKDLNVHTTTTELKNILYKKEYRQNMLNEYEKLRIELGQAGASARTAKLMLNYLNSSTPSID